MIPGEKATFVRALRVRFKKAKADRILQYLMQQVNEYEKDCDRVSGYSQAFLPFDRETGTDMTPEQQIALVMRLAKKSFLKDTRQLIDEALAPRKPASEAMAED